MHVCEVTTERDVDWALDRVLLGDRVLVHVGGLRRLRRHRLSAPLALGCLEARIAGVGGDMHVGGRPRAVRRLTRGRTALLLPPDPGGEQLGGVREPRRPKPNPSRTSAAVPLRPAP